MPTNKVGFEVLDLQTPEDYDQWMVDWLMSSVKKIFADVYDMYANGSKYFLKTWDDEYYTLYPERREFPDRAHYIAFMSEKGNEFCKTLPSEYDGIEFRLWFTDSFRPMFYFKDNDFEVTMTFHLFD